MPCEIFEWSCDELVKEYVLQIIIAVSLIGIGGVFNKKIRKYIEIGILWLSDKQVSMTAFYTRKYDNPPTHEFDNEIFDKLSSEIRSDRISKVAINPKFIRLRSERLGMTLDVSIKEEPNLQLLSSNTPEIQSYNVVVKMDADIRGIRQIDRIEDFANLAEKIQNIIHLKCFPNEDARQSFAVCDIDRLDKHRNESIDDESLKSRITFSDKNLKITSSEPQFLRKTVKKYVYV